MTRFTFPLLLAAALPLLAGQGDCGPGPSPIYDNFDDDVSWSSGGCADVSIYASAEGDTLAVFFRSSGQVAATQASGAATTYDLALGTGDAKVEVKAGKYLTSIACNDVVITPPQVDELWTAIGGTATLSIEPDPDGGEWDTYAHATLTLTGVVLLGEDGATVVMDDLGPLEAWVGWFPG